jgi:23S rRNA pseudouridine2457 synthase
LLLAFNKPFNVLSQFTREEPHHRALADFGFPPEVYPIGRLDRDSEGLLLLSDEKPLVDRLLNPRHAHPRRYLAQVEGEISPEALEKLRRGVTIKGHQTASAKARAVPDPQPPPRDPPVRYRKTVPDCWVELELTEGKNRQARRMTAAVGHPTLRLIRVAIGAFRLDWAEDLPPGHWRELSPTERKKLLA